MEDRDAEKYKTILLTDENTVTCVEEEEKKKNYFEVIQFDMIDRR